MKGVALLLLLTACNGGQSAAVPTPSTEPDLGTGIHPRVAVLEAMRADEGERLAAFDFAAAKPWAESSGDNPFLVHRIADDRYVGAFRGTGELIVLDARAEHVSAGAGAPGITGWAWSSDDEAFFAVGDAGGRVHAFAIEGDAVKRTGSWPIAGVFALRDVAIGSSSRLYLADAHRSRILSVVVDKGERTLTPVELGSCGGAVQVRRVGDVLFANCLLEHRVKLFGLGADGLRDGREAVIEHDGPTWAIDVRAVEGGFDIAIAGVEDHPLDRKEGSFGFVDSFVFAYQVRGEPWTVKRVAEVNVGEHGVVTPKWVQWQDDGTIATAGYGSAGGAIIDPTQALVDEFALPAGIVSIAGTFGDGIAADPLLDAWIVLGNGTPVVRVLDPNDARPPSTRLGEALVFTTLMAPAGSSTGKLSRFTCETCHFEGLGDGRVHHTGRGDVHASTKTIRGLFGNRPHFTRALDRTTTAMIDNEFNVASRGTSGDPWFDLHTDEHPWLANMGVTGRWSPEQLRRAVFEFLVTFTPDRNPAAIGRKTFDATEQRGAAVFEEHCESCHRARLRSDDPASRVAPADWAAHVLGNGAILWASDERMKTGVEPYVHDEGARVTSLRRLWVKSPYFTNGSARDLDAVLERSDLGPPFRHAADSEGRRLTQEERVALRAFLDLL